MSAHFQAMHAIKAARIGRNLGKASGYGYALKHNIPFSLVRLALQLESAKRAGL